MALTSVSTPTDYDIAYRPIEWEVETSVVNLDSVEYKLFDTLTASEIVSILAQPKFGDSDNFATDMRTFIQDYLGNDIDIITPNGTHYNTGLSIRSFYITATEKILTASGTFNDGDTLTSSGVFILNASLNVGDAALAGQNYFNTVSGVDTLWLTDKPNYLTRSGESEYIMGFNNEENVGCTIVATDTSGATVTGVISPVTLGNQTCYLGIGYNNVNAYTLSAGTQPLIDANTASYTLDFSVQTTGYSFETISVNVDREYRTDPVRFFFVNNYGGIDSFTTYALKEQSVEIATQISQRPVTDYTSITSYGRFRPNTSMTTVFRVGTNNLSNDEILWLKQLISSAGVWVQEGTLYRPVVIRTDSLLIESNIQGREVFSIQFEYELANALRRQKG